MLEVVRWEREKAGFGKKRGIYSRQEGEWADG